MTEPPTSREPLPATTVAVGLVAVVSGAMALTALVLPAAARPMISLVIAFVLATVAFLAVRHRAALVGQQRSPFDHDAGRVSGELPTELGALMQAVEATNLDQPIPEVFGDRLRRCSMRRLRERHGVDLRADRDWRRLSTMVSPELYHVLTGNAESVPSRVLTLLVDEVEAL